MLFDPSPMFTHKEYGNFTSFSTQVILMWNVTPNRALYECDVSFFYQVFVGVLA